MPHEYEDALASDPQSGRFAIADGAAESVLAGDWGRLLVEAFVRNPVLSAGELDGWVADLQPQWDVEASAKPLPWYAESKLADGAFAAFLGLTLWPDGGWRAVAVGDSCVFHLRRGELLAAFPIDDPARFDTRPWLIGSRCPTGVIAEQGRGRDARGEWTPGDGFLLMTDALAEWFLRRTLDLGGPPLPDVGRLLGVASDPGRSAELIDRLQRQGPLRNDDVTLLSVTL